MSDQLETLGKVFESIDGSIVYYNASNRFHNGISFTELKTRVAQHSRQTLQLSHIQQIMTLWPEAYNLSIQRNSHKLIYLISAPSNLASDTQNRIVKFKLLCNRWAITEKLSQVPLHHLPSPDTSPTKIESIASQRMDSLRKTPQKNQSAMPTPSPSPTNANRIISMMERIRAKDEANKKIDIEQLQREKYQKFIQSQHEAIAKVLISLSSSKRDSSSFSLDHVISRLRDSLKTKLGVTETTDALSLLADKVPEFCQVINCSNIRAVRNHKRMEYPRSH